MDDDFIEPGLLPNQITDINPGQSAEQILDGLNCKHCVFTSPTLTYGGGAAKLLNTEFDGVVKLNLIGAAANTVRALEWWQEMMRQQRPPATPPPWMKAPPQQVNLVSPITLTLDTSSK